MAWRQKVIRHCEPMNRSAVKCVLLGWLVAGLSFCGCAARGGPVANTPEPIQYQHIVRHDPNFSIHVVKVNLKNPRVSVHVARGGADPDGDGPWLTTLQPTS